MNNLENINTNESGRPDVMLAVMKLTRAMRRRPPKPEEGIHPGMGRPLSILADNDGVTSRELAELMDVRPSSLTEMLDRLDKEGLVTRATDSEDRRVSRVSLTEKGRELAAKMKAEHEQRAARVSACFTDEEAAAFCQMCERLAAHLESMAGEDGEPDGFMPPPHHHHFGGCGPCGGFPGNEFGGRHGHRHPPRAKKL